MCHDIIVEAREQLVKSVLFFYPCGPWASDSVSAMVVNALPCGVLLPVLGYFSFISVTVVQVWVQEACIVCHRDCTGLSRLSRKPQPRSWVLHSTG